MLRATSNGVTLALRALPGAKKTAVVGIYGENVTAQLKIAVHALPIEGRANAELIGYLSELFSISKAAVELVSGASSRSKVFLLRGISLAQAELTLSQKL